VFVVVFILIRLEERVQALLKSTGQNHPDHRSSEPQARKTALEDPT
jgi:hypothetical protein